MRWAVVAAAVSLLALAAPARADTIVMKNGGVLSGKVLSDGDDVVVLEVADGKGKMTIHKVEVARVIASKPAAPGQAQPKNPFEHVETAEIERRLAALGPVREELLASLEPTPAEAEELARLERALDSGSADDAKCLAAKGRAGLVVAARALSAPSRKRRAAAALAVVELAADETLLPLVLALDFPEKLLLVIADETDADSPAARLAGRRALEAIARRECTCDGVPTASQTLTADERAALEEWRGWWAHERPGVLSFEKETEMQRAELRAELARRGVPVREPARVVVRLSRSPEKPAIPEPELLLPRLVVLPPTTLALAGEARARMLRFEVAIENRGAGALELRGEVEGAEVRAVQRVFARYPGNPAVVAERERTVGRLVRDETDGHWHVGALARAELLDETFAAAVGARASDQLSACLVDAQRVGGADGAAVYTSCARERMGLSPGFRATTFDEAHSIAVGRTPDGVYWLVVSLAATFESASSKEDVVAAVRIRLAGRTLEVLERIDGKTLLERRAARERAKAGE